MTARDAKFYIEIAFLIGNVSGLVLATVIGLASFLSVFGRKFK